MGEFQKEVAALLPWRKGHFKLESGHHGDTWLNLELLCVQPGAGGATRGGAGRLSVGAAS